MHYYLTQLVLSPHETRAIDLRALRDAQTPDLKGSRIPANATDGSVNWVRADLVPVTGRVVVINRNDGTASSFDCCTGKCPSSDISMYFSNAPATIDVGSSNLQLAPVINDEDCNNNWYFIDGGYNDCTWNDSYTSVATVDSTGWVTGVAGGVTTITMYANGMQYDCSNNCTQTPTQLDASGSTTVTVYISLSVTVDPTSAPANTDGTQMSTAHGWVSYTTIALGQIVSANVDFVATSPSPSGNSVYFPQAVCNVQMTGGPGTQPCNVAVNGDSSTVKGSVVIQGTISPIPAGTAISNGGHQTATATLTIN